MTTDEDYDTIDMWGLLFTIFSVVPIGNFTKNFGVSLRST
jgi:hypothetical protein